MVKLTRAEKEALDLLAQGLTNQQIADALTLSSSAIALRLNTAYKKLGVRNRVEAVKKFTGAWN